MAMQQELKGKVEDQTPKEKVKSLRIRVVDNTKEGRPAVNIKLPIGVVKFGVKMAQALPEVKGANVDWDSITAMIQEGAEGKIGDVEDEAKHTPVEVWVE